jgi:hypothetical protein
MSGNEKSVDIYIKYVTEQISRHKLKERIQDIIDDLQPNFINLSIHQTNCLYDVDQQLTDILLSGERLCSQKVTLTSTLVSAS